MRREAELQKTYAQVREEWLVQVLDVPQNKRSKRANLMLNVHPHATAAAERRPEMLRDVMGELRKLETNPAIVLAGYESIAQTLIKVIEESMNRIKISRIELDSLEQLRRLEIEAFVRRIEVGVWISNGIHTVQCDGHESCTTLVCNFSL